MLEILISLFIYRLISDRFVDIDPRFWKAVGEGVIEIIYDVSSGISHLIPVASCRCIAEEVSILRGAMLINSVEAG
ncbi:MAG: hypothetical protein RQ885_07795 [Desulfurococcales archaeon]|jgi:hypothetical protein|nr:hypothetical protein [Desulfurococcales archaeon]